MQGAEQPQSQHYLVQATEMQARDDKALCCRGYHVVSLKELVQHLGQQGPEHSWVQVEDAALPSACIGSFHTKPKTGRSSLSGIFSSLSALLGDSSGDQLCPAYIRPNPGSASCLGGRNDTVQSKGLVGKY